MRITVETCPHFLTLTAEEVPDGATEFKCCPPIREAANQDALWQALADGTIDCVVSDHSPVHRRPEDRRLRHRVGRHLLAPTGPARRLDRGADRAATPWRTSCRWMSTRTAALVGLGARKGAIEAGRDADFAVLAPDETFTVDPAALQHRNRSPRTRADPARCRQIDLAARRTHRGGRRVHRPEGPTPHPHPLIRPPISPSVSRHPQRRLRKAELITVTAIPSFTGDANPYGGGDPYADYRTADFPFTHLRRPRRPPSRRRGDRRQRRVLRRAREPAEARARRVRPRALRPQGQDHGRLGDPAPARRVPPSTRTRRPRTTTGRSYGSARPASCAASSSTPPTSAATTRRPSPSRRRRCPAPRPPRNCSRTT